MPKEYKIETINDMMEIPLERFEAFLSELTHALMLAKMAHANNKAMGCKEATIPKPFIWIDVSTLMSGGKRYMAVIEVPDFIPKDAEMATILEVKEEP